MDTQKIYHEMGISSAVLAFCCSAEEKLKPRFAAIDAIAEYNQAKVVAAMQKNRVSAECFAASTGYGYNDIGREALEKVYADTFHTEAALVRPQITCGTHALALALAANLRPGDELYSPVGRPYDTLEEVIGIRPCKGSLAEFGITYRETELLPDGTFDYENIRKSINEKTKLITIQRSKGYATRPTFSVKQIGELIAFCKGIQAAAPVDSYVTPEPWAMPGYDSDVIMAAGAFVQGSSIELSADGPIREPYAIYYQGGLTWAHAKLGILMSLQKMCDAGLITLPEA